MKNLIDSKLANPFVDRTSTTPADLTTGGLEVPGQQNVTNENLDKNGRKPMNFRGRGNLTGVPDEEYGGNGRDHPDNPTSWMTTGQQEVRYQEYDFQHKKASGKMDLTAKAHNVIQTRSEFASARVKEFFELLDKELQTLKDMKTNTLGKIQDGIINTKAKLNTLRQQAAEEYRYLLWGGKSTEKEVSDGNGNTKVVKEYQINLIDMLNPIQGDFVFKGGIFATTITSISGAFGIANQVSKYTGSLYAGIVAGVVIGVIGLMMGSKRISSILDVTKINLHFTDNRNEKIKAFFSNAIDLVPQFLGNIALLFQMLSNIAIIGTIIVAMVLLEVMLMSALRHAAKIALDIYNSTIKNVISEEKRYTDETKSFDDKITAIHNKRDKALTDYGNHITDSLNKASGDINSLPGMGDIINKI